MLEIMLFMATVSAPTAGDQVNQTGLVFNKDGPFTETRMIKPGDQLKYNFSANTGQNTLRIKPQFDAILDVVVLQNGEQVAQENGQSVISN